MGKMFIFFAKITMQVLNDFSGWMFLIHLFFPILKFLFEKMPLKREYVGFLPTGVYLLRHLKN